MTYDYALKCAPGPFRAVWRGQKKAEVRKDDRGYQVGDRVKLMEHECGLWLQPYREVIVEITHVVPGGQWGLPAELCVWSFKVLQRRIGLGRKKIQEAKQ